MGGVHAAAVVTNLDHDLGALVIGVEIDRATSGLPSADALLGWLNTVIHRVADKMHERFRKCVKNTFVEIGVLAREFKSHVLAALLGDVADEPGEAAE